MKNDNSQVKYSDLSNDQKEVFIENELENLNKDSKDNNSSYNARGAYTKRK